MLESILKENEINIFDVNFSYSLTHLPEMIMSSTAQYFREKGENVIYFPLDQTFNFSLEELEAILLAHKLEKNIDLLSFIYKHFDLKINPWDLDEIQKGKNISGGALKIVNYFATVYSAPKDSIIIINKYDQSLHQRIKEHTLNGIISMAKPKYLIVTSYGNNSSAKEIEELSEALKESLKNQRKKME